MAELTELTDEMKAAIGTREPTTVYEVTTQGIRTFARAVGYRDPVFYDEDEARKRGHPSLLAPPGFLGMPRHNRPAPRVDARARAYRSPFRRALNGGTRVEPLQPVYAGDVLDAVTTLKNLELRAGRRGKMLIRTSETVYTRRSDSAVVARTTGTGISY